METIYSELIAGVLPSYGKKTTQAVMYAAVNALSNDRVHVVLSEHDGSVFYLAVPSSCLASVPDFAPGITAALPTHPYHNGDGAYVEYHDEFAVAALKQGSALRIVCNGHEAVRALIDDEGLFVFDVTDAAGKGWRFDSPASRSHRVGTQLNASLTKLSFAWLLLVTVAYGVVNASAYEPTDRGETTNTRQEQINALVERLEFSSPAARDLDRLNRIAAVAIESRGYITSYESKKGEETFTLKLPSWVGPTQLKQLGDEYAAEFSAEENVILVSKNK